MNLNSEDRAFFHGLLAASAILIGFVYNFSVANEYTGVWLVPMKTGLLFEPTFSDFGFPKWASIGVSIFMTLLYFIIPTIAAIVARLPATLICFAALLGLSFFNTDGIRQVAQFYSS
jgi:hypothetical protein